MAVSDLLEGQFLSEREALADPEQRPGAGRQPDRGKERAPTGCAAASPSWQQTLTDGIQDLQADVEHDLRNRIRQITKQADESIENTDPVEAWDEFQAWLYRRVAEDVVHSYTFLYNRSRELVQRVASTSARTATRSPCTLDIQNPNQVLAGVDASTDLELQKLGVAPRG